jgi:hypothetical protein
MATTVGQHAVSTFSTPQNGDALNADIVRGNDNTLRAQYVDHDADPGIHVQSSSLASRPAASVAGSGAKWINSDYPQKLWISDGTNWDEVGGDSINVLCKATETLVKGDVVKVTGFNLGQDVVEVAKVSSASDVAFGIAETNIANGALGYVVNTGIIEDVNTGAFAIGNILYPNTSGGLTATKPTSGNYQPVAFVLRANASNGILYTEFSTPRIVEASANTASTIVQRDASGNFSAGTITAALTGNASTATALQTSRNINGVAFNGTADITVPAAAGTLTGATLASGVTASSLTSVGTLTSLSVSGSTTLSSNATVNGLRLGRGTSNNNNTTAFGLNALDSETTGTHNTAIGANALTAVTNGGSNTAIGSGAGQACAGGSSIVAIGYLALSSATAPSQSVAVGDGAMSSATNNSGLSVAVGTSSLAFADGLRNTAVGWASLGQSSTGANNTAIGSDAGRGPSPYTNANTTGSNNTFIGNEAVGASATASNVITLGNSSIATLRCQVTTITSLSDARDKKDIVDIPAGLDFVKALQPRAFLWEMRDGGKVDVPEFGFIAQELQAAQAETGITVPGLVYDENPEKLEASAGVLIPILVQAIKQLEARVAALEAGA